MGFRAFFTAMLLMCWLAAASAAEVLQVGSKRFTESFVLGEILTSTAATGARAVHRQGLGNTAIVLEALKSGSIDVYPEYLGTIAQEVLRLDGPATLERINLGLAPLGLGAAVPLGFDNSYALAMREADAARLGVRTLSELAAHPALRPGLSHEFLGRADGWPGLARRYALRNRPQSLDHGLAYDAMASSQIDLMDIYTTDARIGRMNLRVLEDDRAYFPRYDAVLLYRLDLPVRFPAAWQALRGLEGRMDQRRMIALNAAVELEGRSFAQAAQEFLHGAPATATARSGLAAKMMDRLGFLTWQHLSLVLVSVVAATLAGVPLGVIAAIVPRLRQAVLGVCGVLQTIPSLALLAILISLLGTIGTGPALIALSLYALLPVVRNTCTGLLQVSPGIRSAAMALGLERRDTLLLIELPLALPVILAGIKTAAIMSVGTATIAAFIGAGGYGERIAVGLALNDHEMLLAGAIPAAVLALLTQGFFEAVEYVVQRRRTGL